VDPAVQNWLRSAEYDLSAAEHMLASGHTLYVVKMKDIVAWIRSRLTSAG